MSETKQDVVDRGLTKEPKKARKAKKVKLPKLTSGWKLFMVSLKDYRKHWQKYVLILGVVAVPGNMIAYAYASSTDQIVTSYVSFASIIMNVAFLWAMTRSDKTGDMPGLRQAYYEGPAVLVRFVFVSLALIVFLIPAALGLGLYDAAASSASYSNTNSPELALIGIAALALCIPTVIFLVRVALAPIAVVYDDSRPMAALKLSWRYTKGRYWALMGRFAQLIVYLLLASLPAALLTSGMSYLGWIAPATIFFGAATTLIVLPIANRYILTLLQEIRTATDAKDQAE
jgi:hypothetical protein